jgi:hypothetical protein
MESKTNVIPLWHEQVVVCFMSLWRKCRLEPLMGNCFSAIGDELLFRVLSSNLSAHQTEVSIYKPAKALQR